MRAVTLHQPWAWCIVHAGKRLENRSWAPPAKHFGERIAIHAGKKLDTAALRSLRKCRLSVRVPDDFERGAIVATAIYTGYCTCRADAEALGLQGWWGGPLAWVLEDVQPVVPAIACRGLQGLWEIPPGVFPQFEEAADGS